VDTPKRHPFLPYQGFWENKWVIARHQWLGAACPWSRRGRPWSICSVFDHSYNSCNAYGWGRELVCVAREENTAGPDAPDIPAMIDAAEI
jgi:hypothetical protein